ncbi:PqqD family protein [Cohnella lubricantis]|uniref:PqqD family protein n=1 Tax=Cohnella lubricantis TaxID=2163172 RepID=A0A841TD06_9BACL|nr:PqqD family protein [Cohnella lubricantis]MBB6676857.1 PqqD family protein [Cohnella lubricantis]MBP2119437.1 hypothetical protein [Cohnella lubricantis]
MTYRRHQAVEVLEIDGETILLNQETLAVTKLNETGGRIWELLSENRTLEQVAERICGEFDGAEAHRIREDVALFLDQMIEIGLIHRAG